VGSNPARGTLIRSSVDYNLNDLDENSSIYTYISFNYWEEFLEYLTLQNYSQSHFRHVTCYFKKHFKDKKFESPMALQKYIQSKQSGVSTLIKTARVYLNYCEKFEKIPISTIEKYRKFLKSVSHKPDVFVPNDKEVLSAYNQIKDNKELELVFLILMTSGIRYIECLDFLNSYDLKKFRVFDGFVSYTVSDNRRTKNINNIYLPLFVYNKLFHISVSKYDVMRMCFKRAGCNLALKYLRKWHYNFLLYQNVPESVADFIQGRASKSVSANHYLAKAQQVEHWYPKIALNLPIIGHEPKL
jgi:intergrase/recombinase